MNTKNGFTLLELLLVAVALAIFGAIVIPQVTDSQDDVKLSAAQHAVRAMQSAVDREYARTGAWPAEIKAEWFRNYKFPVNPYNPKFEGQTTNTWGDVNQYHPGHKSVDTHPEPFFYNATNGIVRVRVQRQATDEETVALYNLANGTNITSMGQSGWN